MISKLKRDWPAYIGIAVFSTILYFLVKYPTPTESQLDSQAVARVQGKNLIPSPTPQVIVQQDPDLQKKVDDLSKEVQSLR